MNTVPALEVSGISKSFGATQALIDVQFTLLPGEIHALCGENGAGKSTLMKVIDGIVRPDHGEIRLRGEKQVIGSPARAQALGIGFVHQEIALCGDISVAENICMAATNQRRSFFMNYAEIRAKARSVMADLGEIDPDLPVSALSIAEQQVVEIAKALTLDCRILILDEPTAALTEREAAKLFAIMHGLKARGISIIYISHRMAEIFAHCDRITVMRDGRVVCTEETAATSPEEVVRRMVGRSLDQLYPSKRATDALDDIILSVANLSDGHRFRDISFELRAGEILGLAGLIGAGRTEIAEGICGLRPLVQGEIQLAGAVLKPRHYGESAAAGIVYLSEDRKGAGVFLDLPIAANVSALRLSNVARGMGLIDGTRERGQATAFGRALGLKCGSVDDAVATLSGGNQQKVALAKLLTVAPKVLLLDEPTRGVDVGAKAEIHRILRDLAAEGAGILAISSELPELIGLCDRILVVHEGRLAGEISGAEMTEEAIIHLASGLAA